MTGSHALQIPAAMDDPAALPKMVHDVLLQHNQALFDRLENWLLNLDLRLHQISDQAEQNLSCLEIWCLACRDPSCHQVDWTRRPPDSPAFEPHLSRVLETEEEELSAAYEQLASVSRQLLNMKLFCVRISFHV